MGYKKQIIKSIASLVLLIALMLPAVIQFVHLFEGHEHASITLEKTTVHESIPKCDICSFHLASFDYNLVLYPNLVLTEIPVKVDVNFDALQLHFFTITNKQLRAPPIFS